jgi:hypothetical protein
MCLGSGSSIQCQWMDPISRVWFTNLALSTGELHVNETAGIEHSLSGASLGELLLLLWLNLFSPVSLLSLPLPSSRQRLESIPLGSET